MRVPRDNLLPEPGSQPDETSFAMAEAVENEINAIATAQEATPFTQGFGQKFAPEGIGWEKWRRSENVEDFRGDLPAEHNEPLKKLGQLNKKFDPEGDDYDIERARSSGMKGAEGEPPYKEHIGSVVRTTPEERQKHGLPDESYLLLKGRKHEAWDLAVEGERERGFKIIKKGGRYYSVPE